MGRTKAGSLTLAVGWLTLDLGTTGGQYTQTHSPAASFLKLKRVSIRDAPGGTVYWTTHTYDGLGRTPSVAQPYRSKAMAVHSLTYSRTRAAADLDRHHLPAARPELLAWWVREHAEQDVVQQIGAVPRDQNNKPRAPVTITRMVFQRKGPHPKE